MTHSTIRSLKNHGMDADFEAMFDMGREAMALPLEEKMKYELGDEGGSFGFVLGFPSRGQRMLMKTLVSIPQLQGCRCAGDRRARHA